MPVYGFLANFGARRFPKGNEGKRVSSGHNRRRRLAPRSSGKQQAGRTAVRTAPIVCPEESPLARPQTQAFCRWGLTRRLRRGRWGCRPDGGSYFLSARKKVPKKARGTATTEKRLLLPILTAGLAMSRAMKLASLPIRAERARARLFPPTKWAGLFPSAAYRRSASPPHGWGWSAALAGWAVTARHGRFSRGAGQRVWETASAGGASREARCRAAVTPQPSCMSFDCSAPIGRGVGCRGTAPAREARCRAAVTPQPSCMSPYAPRP